MIKKILEKRSKKIHDKFYNSGYLYACKRIMSGATALELDSEMFTDETESNLRSTAFDHGMGCALRDAIERGFIEDDRI